MSTRIIPTVESVTVNNYPYGSLKCEATFAIEFDPKKGFRSLFQTVNPKNGRTNNPKKGTYNSIMYLTQDEQGFVHFNQLSFYKVQDYNKIYAFLAQNLGIFTGEQIEYIYRYAIASLAMTVKAYAVYNGSDVNEVKAFCMPLIEKLKEGREQKRNIFGELHLDYEGLEATKKEGYNPFVIKEYSPAH